MKRRIFFFSQFPPPVHGFSSVNQFIYDKLIEADKFDIVKFSFISASGNFFVFYLNRFLRSFYAVYLLIKAPFSINKNQIFYMPVSGGLGMVFEILPWFFAGFFFKKRIMHHHSFQYCHKKSLLMGVMQKFKKENTYNIFLCDCHFADFAKKYDIVNGNTVIIGNEMVMTDLD